MCRKPRCRAAGISRSRSAVAGLTWVAAHRVIGAITLSRTPPSAISEPIQSSSLQAGAGYCREKLRTIAETRAIALRELESIASIAAFPKTDGAFYFLIRVNGGIRPLDLVERLIREHRVAAIPGTAFGLERGCTLRVAYGALDPATAAEGIGRLVRGLRAIMKG